MSNSFDSDRARCFVGPDPGLNCSQKLSADDTWRQRFNKEMFILMPIVLIGIFITCLNKRT